MPPTGPPPEHERFPGPRLAAVAGDLRVKSDPRIRKAGPAASGLDSPPVTW
ncbi:hypothetical protein [Spongiactinospora rosea]|uniref:hypothetical protein n=1 Tax=Spongiactinospora rosea TaxID=2248750 RepID=UPI00131496E9|nr:hypothetical protein [Spongiactinospora rosea]